MHEWFVPLHPQAEIFEGRACPYKPCSDYCRFEKPFCLHDLKAEEVWPRLEKFVGKHLNAAL
jgi:heptosyltransferase-2